MKKTASIAVIAGMLVFWGFSASAQDTTDLQALIESLKAQVAQLQEQINAFNSLKGGNAAKGEIKDVRMDIKETRMELKLTRSLFRGLSGDDVTALQEYLAQDPDLYPEGLVTGFFGPLTENAVKRFQKKHGVEQVGIVGPQTRAKIHGIFVDGGLPPGLAKKDGENVASTTPGTLVTICHYTPGNPANPQTITVGAPAVNAHTAHGDTMGLCGGEDDEGDDTGSTTPDIIPPVISGITVSGISSTTAQVMWNTDENSDSKVWYSMTTPLPFETSSSFNNSSLVMSHDITLSGLTASTTYYFVVESMDGAGNSATSSESSFETLAE